jgi:hypothetical protein
MQQQIARSLISAVEVAGDQNESVMMAEASDRRKHFIEAFTVGRRRYIASQ